MKPMLLNSLRGLLLTIPLILLGCSSGGGNAGGPGTPSGDVTGSGGGGTVVPVVASVDLTSSADTIGLSDQADLTATVLDTNGDPKEGVTVSFTLSGDVSDAKITSSDVTDANGQATAVLKPGNTPGDVNVVAKANNVSSTAVTVTITTAATDSVTASILPVEITLNGQAVMTAVVKDVDGNAIANKAVQFDIVAGSPAGATIDAANGGLTDGAGTASATITPGNAVGTVTARATADNKFAEAAVDVIAASSGSIAFVSAVPTLIGVTGSGLPETSIVTFEIKDETGAPVADGTPVTFQLKASPLSDAALLDTLDLTSGGQASVVVTSGTVVGPVQVIAKVTLGGNQISTVSNSVTVGSGPPAGNHVSIARTPTNIAGRKLFGLTANVTAFGADRFSNFVPEGSAFAFVTESGGIEPQGLTAPAGGVYLGTTTVKLQSQAPLPADGWVDAITFINGEESFVDANGNGRYDAGEDFFDIGEPFIDQNDNGQWDGDKDPSDGIDDAATDNSKDRVFDPGVDFNDACPSAGTAAPLSRSFFFDVDGDGEFDDNEDVDIATRISDADLFRDLGLEGNGFEDTNGDCKWQIGEVFLDPWGNGPFGGDGRYLPGIDYTDINSNGRYDDGEAFIQEVFFDGEQANAKDGVYDGPNGVWDDSLLVFDRIKIIFSGRSRTFASPSYEADLTGAGGTLPENATTVVHIYIGDDLGHSLAGGGTIAIGSDGDGKVIGAGSIDVIDGIGTHFAVTVLNNTGTGTVAGDTKPGVAAVTVEVTGSDNGDIAKTAVAIIPLL